MRRITINSVQKKETSKDSEKIIQKVLTERKYMIDAAVVKTMKTRKLIAYRELVREVISLVRFPLEIADLNKRIEHLRNEEYLEQQDKAQPAFNP